MGSRVSPELAACSASVKPLALVTGSLPCVILSPGLLPFMPGGGQLEQCEGSCQERPVVHSSVCASLLAGALQASPVHEGSAVGSA